MQIYTSSQKSSIFPVPTSNSNSHKHSPAAQSSTNSLSMNFCVNCKNVKILMDKQFASLNKQLGEWQHKVKKNFESQINQAIVRFKSEVAD